jgi:hypothetical protein
MTTVATSEATTNRSTGRGYLWGGLALCLLGLVLTIAQFSLKYLFVPWYSPALATIGAFLMLRALAGRRSIPRMIALVLVAAFAGLQWYVFGSLMKLPSYEGPARAGKSLPAFTAMFADGRPFTDADLRDGSKRVLVFFRGRW